MSDDQPQQPVTDNAAAAIEKAKAVADRFNRQLTFLRALNTRLPVLENALAVAKKVHAESGDDVSRLTKEVEYAKKHIAQLDAWVANNLDMPENVAAANELAAKIKRLQKDIERKRQEMHRLEAGLPPA